MPLIECIPGPAETPVAGIMYSFQRDAYGRYVASVQRFEHIACLLATPHYRQVPDVPEEAQGTTFKGFVETIKQTTMQKAPDAPAMPENSVETVTAIIEDGSSNAAPLMDPIAVPSEEPAAPANKKKGGRPSKTSLVS